MKRLTLVSCLAVLGLATVFAYTVFAYLPMTVTAERQAPAKSLVMPGEKHLANMRQLTFGGEIAARNDPTMRQLPIAQDGTKLE